MNGQSLSRHIQQSLATAFTKGLLDASLTTAMFPALTKAVTPAIQRYIERYETFPSLKVFKTIVNNYNQDGPLVQALLAYQTPQSAQQWQQLHQKLSLQAQRQWPQLDMVHQDKLVGETYLRVYRYLPTFLFLARLDTWIFTIMKNEYSRLQARQPELPPRYLSDPVAEDLTLADQIPADEPSPDEITGKKAIIADFWARLERLEQQSGVELLKMHLSGYTLREIQAELGEDSPVLSTIQRRLKRIMKRISADPEIGQIARHLGMMSIFLVYWGWTNNRPISN